MSKESVIEKCQELYKRSSYYDVIAHVETEKAAENPDYKDVKYKTCQECDNDMPSIDGICLVCGQPTGETKYKVWVEVERIDTFDDEEVYRDTDFPESIAYRETFEDASELQQQIVNAFGEIQGTTPQDRENELYEADELQILIDAVIEQIKEDVADGDLTAVDELLKFVPPQYLKGYLPEKL